MSYMSFIKNGQITKIETPDLTGTLLANEPIIAKIVENNLGTADENFTVVLWRYEKESLDQIIRDGEEIAIYCDL